MCEKWNRKSNFTETELNLMTDEVTKHQNVLFSSFSSSLTNKLKIEIWNEIAEK